MLVETLPQLLKRVTVNHLGTQTIGYIKHLEAVAEAAKSDNKKGLNLALKDLDNFLAKL